LPRASAVHILDRCEVESTLACGGTQFRRLDRHSGTLYVLDYWPWTERWHDTSENAQFKQERVTKVFYEDFWKITKNKLKYGREQLIVCRERQPFKLSIG